MDTFISVVFLLLHFGIIIFLLIYLPRTFVLQNRKRNSFATGVLITEIFAMLLLLVCFANYEMSSFRNEKYFFIFSWMTLLSVVGYWINKVIPPSSKILKTLSLTFLGAFFWLCFFTAIKFGPYLPYVWFPLLGLYALAPIILAIFTLSEIRYHSSLSSRFNTLKILGLGLIPLVLIQVVLNLFTPYTWEFIKIFNPGNTNIF
jgi:hypothetical protein